MRKRSISTRKKAIKELIKQVPIKNQEMLIDLLKEKYGIATNQSIISRDLRELNVIKRSLNDQLVYELQEFDVYKEILQLGITDVINNEFLVVIKTLPGLAAFVGDYLDRHAKEYGILATIAGENVVFITPITVKDIEEFYRVICRLVYFKIHHSKA